MWTAGTDWECDICNRPESIVGELSMGRTPVGRDFQICKSCLIENELEKRSDVDKYYERRYNGDS